MKNTKKPLGDKPIGKVTIIPDTFPKPDQIVMSVALTERSASLLQSFMSEYGSATAVIEDALIKLQDWRVDSHSVIHRP